VVYLNGHWPVFTHEVEDLASFHLFTTQLIGQSESNRPSLWGAAADGQALLPTVSGGRSQRVLPSGGATARASVDAGAGRGSAGALGPRTEPASRFADFQTTRPFCFATARRASPTLSSSNSSCTNGELANPQPLPRGHGHSQEERQIRIPKQIQI
jgi:hypothetical protein